MRNLDHFFLCSKALFSSILISRLDGSLIKFLDSRSASNTTRRKYFCRTILNCQMLEKKSASESVSARATYSNRRHRYASGNVNFAAEAREQINEESTGSRHAREKLRYAYIGGITQRASCAKLRVPGN